MVNTRRFVGIIIGVFATLLVSMFIWIIYVIRMDIHGASERGELEKVKDILEKRGELVNSRDELGRSPIIFAVATDKKAVVAYLLSKGADLEGKDNLGQTPLHWAAMYGHKQIIEMLISAGADVNAEDYNGETPLYEALYWDKEILELFVSNGAEIHDYLLYVAAQNGYKNAVEYFIMKGTGVNTRDEDGRTPYTWSRTLWTSGFSKTSD